MAAGCILNGAPESGMTIPIPAVCQGKTEMLLPPEVHRALSRIENALTRQALHAAFQRWELTNRTLTKLLLAKAHRVPLCGRTTAFGLGLVLHNPLTSAAGAYLTGANLLEAWIRRLAEHYEKQGLLTDETRRHFEELVAALERSGIRT
jgi:hypothetical protein